MEEKLEKIVEKLENSKNVNKLEKFEDFWKFAILGFRVQDLKIAILGFAVKLYGLGFYFCTVFVKGMNAFDDSIVINFDAFCKIWVFRVQDLKITILNFQCLGFKNTILSNNFSKLQMFSNSSLKCKISNFSSKTFQLQIPFQFSHH